MKKQEESKNPKKILIELRKLIGEKLIPSIVNKKGETNLSENQKEKDYKEAINNYIKKAASYFHETLSNGFNSNLLPEEEKPLDPSLTKNNYWYIFISRYFYPLDSVKYMVHYQLIKEKTLNSENWEDYAKKCITKCLFEQSFGEIINYIYEKQFNIKFYEKNSLINEEEKEIKEICKMLPKQSELKEVYESSLLMNKIDKKNKEGGVNNNKLNRFGYKTKESTKETKNFENIPEREEEEENFGSLNMTNEKNNKNSYNDEEHPSSHHPKNSSDYSNFDSNKDDESFSSFSDEEDNKKDKEKNTTKNKNKNNNLVPTRNHNFINELDNNIISNENNDYIEDNFYKFDIQPKKEITQSSKEAGEKKDIFISPLILNPEEFYPYDKFFEIDLKIKEEKYKNTEFFRYHKKDLYKTKSVEYYLDNYFQKPKKFFRFRFNELNSEATTLKKQNFQCFFCKKKFKMLNETTPKENVLWCSYFMKFSCEDCISEKYSVIPEFILKNWNFKKFSISKKGYEIIEKLKKKPIICLNVKKKGGGGLDRIKELKEILLMKQKLREIFNSMSHYNTENNKREFRNFIIEKMGIENDYLLVHEDIFSLQDLIDIKNGQNFKEKLNSFIEKFLEHLYTCEKCKIGNKGIKCCYCKNNKMIFSYDVENIMRCKHCGIVFHKKCVDQHNYCCKASS